MRSIRSVLLVITVLCFASTLLAEYPLPTGPNQTLNTYNGLKLWPYESPYADHVGRFVDSAFTVDLLHPPPRTLRAKEVSVVPENNRVYMQMGEHFVGYSLSTFFTSKLGSPLTAQLTSNHGAAAEKYLAWDGHVYPESTGSGWSTYVLDGQQRLFDYDWDDRGYTYPAYYIWGFGIVQDSNFRTVRQVDWNETDANPQEIASFKANGKYYIIVGGSKTEIWDVTSPTSPVKVRTVEFGLLESAVAHLSSGDALGLVVSRYDNALGRTVTSFDVYRASDLVLGGSPVQSIVAASATSKIADVATDETNFYVIEKPTTGRSFTMHTMVLSSPSGPTYTRKEYAISGIAPSGIRYGSDHLTIWGSDDTRAYDIWLYRLESNVPVRRELGDFIKNHYTRVTPPAGYTNPALEGYTADIYNALYTKHGGKEYLIVSAKGLGDVYELESPDRLSISMDGVGGTPNQNSPTAGTGIYYGDPIKFSSSYGAGDLTVNWDFGNPESAQNSRTTAANSSLTHQYAGLTTATAIQAVKTVTAADAANSSNNATTSVSMSLPKARLKLAGTNHVVPDANIASVGVVRGDTFVDASDGTLQSHYVDWNLDGTTTSAHPSYALPIGTCGPHTLSHSARYVPYTGSGTSITPTLDASKHYVTSVSPITFEAKPFMPFIEVSSNATTVTFSNKTRVRSGTFNSGATWNVNWQLMNGATIVDAKTATTALGTVDTFQVDKSAIQAGYKVVLGISIDASVIAEATCAADTNYLLGETSFTLEPPDPTVKTVGCTEAGGLCELTMSSASGKSISDWTIAWSLNNTQTASGPTYKPSFPAEGTYQIKGVATNDFGSQTWSQSFTVTAPACSGSPTAVSINYRGLSSGCLGSSCTSPTETYEFSPYAWGYSFQECDTFAWDFGDGTKSTQKVATHKFATSGQYKVTLVVKNTNGQAGTSATLTLGTAPPPDGCPTVAPPQYQVFAAISGPCTTANPNCPMGEAISFQGTTFPYRPQECDTFRWTFGDGGSSNSINATHTYNQPGTYTAQFTVSNSKGSSSGTISITVVGEVDPCPKAPLVVGVDYTGQTSGCTATNSTGCLPNEPIKFTPVTWQYHWQECDQFLWEFGDGNTSTQREPTHQYATGGDMTVKLTVTNTKGSSSAEKTFLVGTPATPPTSANFTYAPSHPKPGDAVTFTGSTSGGDPATSWNWDFGDGSTGSGQIVTHTFANEGKFNVALTAGNSGGSKLIEKAVSVTDTMTYFLPVATHAGGANGTEWRTDLHIFQPQFDGPANEVEFEYLGGTRPLFLDRSTHIIEDFLSKIFDADGSSGPVFVRTSVPIEMWTRTYVVSPSGVGTYGQLIPAILLDDEGQQVGTGSKSSIVGLQHGHRYRTNIGFVNPTSHTAELTMTILKEDGFTGGSFPVTVKPHELLQKPITYWAKDLAIGQRFTLRIENLNGVEVFSYASIIDNTSNDPVFVGAVPDSVAADSRSRTVVVPGIGHIGAWRSDLAIFNPGSNPVSMNLDYYDSEGINQASTMHVAIYPKTTLYVEDILRSDLMEVDGDSTGTLHVTTNEATDLYPIVFDRTYRDQGPLGTFGQGITSVPMTAGNATIDTPAFLTGIRNDHLYYTNLGLVSLSDQPTEIWIAELQPNDGRPRNSRLITLAPNQSAIISRLLPQFLNSELSEATILLEVRSGGPIWAYGSIVDDLTKDPEYVPAVPAAPGATALQRDDSTE